ncbi:hypothetical protein LSH36_664g01016 [Paralvinella palmiformis]|uniref:Uncharacterized protein n=1 Tax=Paralvinella palmiformis TaxID=53620 RepID=A0AAD9J2V5_9ANNE|nr:hypothetical protein LSH36_664g01016 [Paralvinella palmiformis]
MNISVTRDGDMENWSDLHANVIRRFYAHWHHRGCSGDIGWLVVLDELPGDCSWEKNGIRPTFLYSEAPGPSTYKGKYLDVESELVDCR